MIIEGSLQIRTETSDGEAESDLQWASLPIQESALSFNETLGTEIRQELPLAGFLFKSSSQTD